MDLEIFRSVFLRFELTREVVRMYKEKRINVADITFVVQGAVGDTTKQCLNSIRRYFPVSKIILSTWGGGKHRRAGVRFAYSE